MIISEGQEPRVMKRKWAQTSNNNGKIYDRISDSPILCFTSLKGFKCASRQVEDNRHVACGTSALV